MADIRVKGRVMDDPNLKFTPNGKALLQFRLSESRKNKKSDTWENNTYRICCWDGAEQAAELISKGDKLVVEGRFWMGSYKGNDGVEHTTLDVNTDVSQISRQGEQDELPAF